MTDEQLKYGGGGAAVQRGNGGNGIAGQCYHLVPELEPATRAIMRAMGGEQPDNSEWAIFFMRSPTGGSIRLYEKMMMAHNVAKAQAK